MLKELKDMKILISCLNHVKSKSYFICSLFLFKRNFNAVIVHPIRLKEFDNKWYLIGFSEHHNSMRTFGLDRIYEPLQLKKKIFKM